MRRGLAKVLPRIRALSAEDKVRFTEKALSELRVLEMDPDDARDVLERLRPSDFLVRVVSKARPEWMYAFRPEVGSLLVYVKLILRHDCVVVSFHEDEGDASGEEDFQP